MKRILVCEDEDAIRDFVVINLKRSGYDVIDVSNAAQAMDAYVHYGGLIDVALLDIMMPGMDGSELCRWLRQKMQSCSLMAKKLPMIMNLQRTRKTWKCRLSLLSTAALLEESSL